MKDVELRLVNELIKNSRRSDRELARKLGSSQPTVTRIRSRLEKQGKIREYTMIPDYVSLSFQIASLTLARLNKPMSHEIADDIMKHANEIEKNIPSPVILAMNGIGLNADYAVVALHKDYSAYAKFMEFMKLFPHVKIDEIESFIITLQNKNHFRYLTFSVLADYVLRRKEHP